MSVGVPQYSPGIERARKVREAVRPYSDQLSNGLQTFLTFSLAYPAVIQGGYYLVTGLWPWIHLRSFLWVTGPKTDTWLVQTAGALVMVIGATLSVAAYRREVSLSLVGLAVGSATVLTLVDFLFVLQGRISAIYLLDALVQLALLGLWWYAWRTNQLQFLRTTPASAAPVATLIPTASVYQGPVPPQAVPNPLSDSISVERSEPLPERETPTQPAATKDFPDRGTPELDHMPAGPSATTDSSTPPTVPTPSTNTGFGEVRPGHL